MAPPDEPSRAERIWLAAILAVAILARLRLNDVVEFSPADESIYVDFSQRLATEGFFAGYAGLAREWVNDASWWRYPSPLRCGYLALTAGAVRLYGRADAQALAWLSTLAGIAVVALLYEIARRLAGIRAALLAASFAAVSPLELAMGRRALQDEVLCAAVLVAFGAVLAALAEPRSTRRLVAAIVALTIALSIKETLLLLFPALAVFVWMYVRPARPALRHVALFIVPPLLWWSLLAALMRDFTMPVRIARLVAGAMSARYVVQYQSGPPHRLLFDLLLVSPFVTALCIAATVMLLIDGTRNRRLREVAVFLGVALATFSLLASKNLRFIVMLDPFVRLIAASIVAFPRAGVEARLRTLIAVAIANAAIELELFRAIFITGAVYDPVTHTLLAALGAVPRSATSAPSPMVWPWTCAVIGVVVWMWDGLRGETRAAPSARSARAIDPAPV